MAQDLAQIVSRLEVATSKLESIAARGGGGGGGGAVSEEDAPFVKAFDEIMKGPFQQYLDISKKIGGDVQGHAATVEAALGKHRDVLVMASRSKKPGSPEALNEALMPLTNSIQDVEAFKNRASSFANHLAAIGASIWSLMWVGVSPTPGPHVKEQYDSSQFYINRVLKDFKEKDQAHVDWTKAWLSALRELQAYIKEYHTTGLSWNPQGGDASAAQAAAKPAGGAAPPPPAGGPPAPPPPPPADLFADIGKDGEKDQKSMTDALFADISKGSDITKGLKKVSKDQMTHKNPNLRISGPQPFKPTPNPKPGTFGVKKVESVKPPKCALEGKKWSVENQNGNKNLVISDTNIKQTVYIYKCDNSTIQVKGKINSIVIDSCKKSALVFDDVISSLDVINCQSVQAQVTGKVLTVSIDKTDGCLIYLSKDSLTAEIIAAKSSEMNILVPDESGEFKEFALPEQYKSVWNGKKFVTEPTDVMG